MMLNKIIQGDALEVLRGNKGHFKKGQHWRKPKPFWEKSWLEAEYLTKGRSSTEIANDYGLGDSAVQYWLKKHGIKTRNVGEVRKIKRWGLSGSKNPMFGRMGALNPRWNGGHSPERQCAYARAAWKETAKEVLRRDGYRCRKCGAAHEGGMKLVVHHVKAWAKHPELRFDKENLLTLCQDCHKKEHSKR